MIAKKAKYKATHMIFNWRIPRTWGTLSPVMRLNLKTNSKIISIVSSALLALALCACAQKQEAAPAATKPTDNAATPKSVTAEALKPLDKKQFGAAITDTNKTSLASVLQEPAKFTNQTVSTEGKVVAVCKSMGCWMEIADDSGQAHIKMAGHSFFIPREAHGHKARVQGKVIAAGAGEDMCGSQDNCRENAAKETGKVAKVEIEATGVEFLD